MKQELRKKQDLTREARLFLFQKLRIKQHLCGFCLVEIVRRDTV
jgi:hypothetical protein